PPLHTHFLLSAPSTTELSPLSLHDALPISVSRGVARLEEELGVQLFERVGRRIVLSSHGKQLQRKASRLVEEIDDPSADALKERSEEHTSELQSPYDLVCRLLLEKKKKKTR